MTRSEKDVLRLVAQGVGRGPLPRAYFDSFPHKRAIAMRLMWAGYIELGGVLAEGVVLTPAGQHVMIANQ